MLLWYIQAMRRMVLIAHNLRSTHNVGSLIRTAEGIGVGKLWLSGHSPYPLAGDDDRLPHLARKTDRQITKTSLGAERSLEWEHTDDIVSLIGNLKKAGFTVAALEQASDSIRLPGYRPPDKLALIVGREVEGLEPEIRELCDLTLEIPMLGRKESFNVVQAAAMALYHCRYIDRPT